MDWPLVRSTPLNFGKTWYVTKTGSDSNPGTLQNPFLTMGKVLSVWNDDDTMMADIGNWRESLVINKQRCSIIGAKRFGVPGPMASLPEPRSASSLLYSTSVSGLGLMGGGGGTHGPALLVPDTINGLYVRDIDFLADSYTQSVSITSATAVANAIGGTAAGIATLTTSGPHGLVAGQMFTVTGVGVAAYNTGLVETAMALSNGLDATHVSYAIKSIPASSSGGSVLVPTPAVKINALANATSGSRRQFVNCGFQSFAGPAFEVWGPSHHDEWDSCIFNGADLNYPPVANFKFTARINQGDGLGPNTWAGGYWRFRKCIWRESIIPGRQYYDYLEDPGTAILMGIEQASWTQQVEFEDCVFEADRSTYIYCPYTDAPRGWSFRNTVFNTDAPLMDTHIQLGYGAKINGGTSRHSLKGIVPSCAAGSEFTIVRSIVSSSIPWWSAGGGLDSLLVTTCSTGFLEIIQITCTTDYTGLAGADDFIIMLRGYSIGGAASHAEFQPDGPAWPVGGGGWPDAVLLRETMANMVKGNTINLDNASVKKQRAIMSPGSTLRVQTPATAGLTGSGVVNIFIKVKRMHDMASLA